jgi:regulatory protein
VAERTTKLLATEALYEYAIGALAKRSLTEAELQRRLTRRAARPSSVDEVIGRLVRAGYLDDGRLAESYARFRRDYEGFGPSRILRDLQRRGVESDTALQAVAETFDQTSEDELIRAQLKRKLGEGWEQRPLDSPKKLHSLFRALIRAGFSSDKIVKALEVITPESEWLEPLADFQAPLGEDEVFD